MTRIDMLSSNLSAGMVEAVITVTLTVCLLVLRHLLSQKPIAMLLGSGKAGLGPFRWPLNGTPRMVAAHRLLVAVLLGGAAGSVALVLFGACGVVKLAGGANRVAAGIGVGVLAGAGLATAMVLITRRPGMIDRYPAMRPMRWTLGVALLDAGTWAVYLAAYEFLLRGLLLGVLVEAAGPIPALAVTVIVDMFAHVPQGRPETLGSSFSAVLFAVLVIVTGSILAPLIAHLAMALSVDLQCARAASRAGIYRSD